jgi:hypothetical protein
MKDLVFSINWNKKLDCDAFTTIRQPSEVFKIGATFKVKVNKHEKGIFTIKRITYITLDQINETMAYLDTGKDKDFAIKLIKRIYNSKDFDWSTQKMVYLLLVRKQ